MGHVFMPTSNFKGLCMLKSMSIKVREALIITIISPRYATGVN